MCFQKVVGAILQPNLHNHMGQQRRPNCPDIVSYMPISCCNFECTVFVDTVPEWGSTFIGLHYIDSWIAQMHF